ncbi:MAG: TrkH family potassium uptake protein [Rickettsiales bacterium]
MKLLQPIFYVLGIILTIYAGIMLLPMLVDLYHGHDDWRVFAISSMVTGFVGMSLYFTHRGVEMTMSIRQAFLFTTMSYVAAIIFGCLPFLFSGLHLSFTDAVFEITSGLTTTGATVINGLDTTPPGILLWRALSNGIGGIGIVVFTLAVLPMMRVGGMQLFKTESSDQGEKAFPRTAQTAGVISVVILSLTATSAFCFWLAGMNGFDAICHALAAIATGGFSTHDKSVGYYNSALIEFVGTVSMLSAALPIILYYRTFRGETHAFFKDPQVQFFLRMVFMAITIPTLYLMYVHNMPMMTAVRYTTFNVVSLITATGFTSTDFSTWGSFTTTLFFIYLTLGGCTGSTSGGIKAYRFMIFFGSLKAQFMRILKPHGIFVVRFGNKPVPESVESSVLIFIIVYLFTLVTLAALGSLFGMEFLTSMSAVAQGMAGVGVGLSPEIGPAGNFSGLTPGAKWVVTLAMFLGRLELFTVMILFVPRFWKG